MNFLKKFIGIRVQFHSNQRNIGPEFFSLIEKEVLA